MSFFTELEIRARAINSLVCVGLDPHLEDLSSPTPDSAREFCLRLIEAASDFTLAFKPNIAFFEAFGPEGLYVLQQLIAAVPGDIPVILDAKRGDIASTARAYAQAAFQVMGAHAVTLNPYLGYDAIEPFLVNPKRGVFLLCRTSNPGAARIQELPVIGLHRTQDSQTAYMVYEIVAQLAVELNQHDNVGLVVGATQPAALRRIRELTSDMWILAPGIGAQGGVLKETLQMGLRSDGYGLILPVSRGISRSSDPRLAAKNMRETINQQRDEILYSRKNRARPAAIILPHDNGELADELLVSGCIKFGQFTLKSGLRSPIYIDLRRLVGDPALLARVASAYLPLLRKLTFDRLAALPYAALPIATAISLMGSWPLVYPRKETKTYGTRVEVEGVYHPGERVVVIDDLATTGGSKFEAINKLQAAGMLVSDVVVLIDRQSGASQALANAGYRMHSVFNLTQLLDYWETAGQVPIEQIQQTRNFIQETQASDEPDKSRIE